MAEIARRAQELLLAMVFLTRLPLGRLLPDRVIPLHRCLWAFPLAGAAVGAVAALPLLMNAPLLVTASLALALSVWLTGGLHEDGLADFADGMGGRDREARLTIMRDSRIGSYGAQALVLSSLVRWSAIAAAGPVAVIAAAIGGRLALVVLMAAMRPARSDGLGHAAGRPGGVMVLVAAAIALIVIFAIATPTQAVAGLLLGAAAAAAVALIAQRRLGGQTGDVLGAAAVLTECAVLIGFALTN